MYRERGERGVKTGSRRVHAGGGANHPEGRQSLPVANQEGDRWEAGLNRKYSGRRSREAVCSPSLDVPPECVEVGCCTHTRCKQVRAIEQDGGD